MRTFDETVTNRRGGLYLPGGTGWASFRAGINPAPTLQLKKQCAITYDALYRQNFSPKVEEESSEGSTERMSKEVLL